MPSHSNTERENKANGGQGNSNLDIDLDRLLTLEEFAAKLKIKLRTARDWRYRRRIPFTRIGRRIYVPMGAVEALLSRNATEALGGGQDQMSAGQGGALTKGTKS